MRPIALIQHEPHQGPGYLQQFLEQQDLRYRLIRPDLGDAMPRRAADFAGIVVPGSEHGVHDDVAWIAPERALLQDALAREVPVLGHCFGAQLLAVAAGARVARNAWPNIGWSRVWVTPDARALFRGEPLVEVFNWHYDTFEIPRGGRRLLFGPHCLNKGFALGPHLALQCHLEVTENSVRDWCRMGRHELQLQGPAIQSEAELLRELPRRTQRLHGLARCAYQHWTAGLLRPPRVRVGAPFAAAQAISR